MRTSLTLLFALLSPLAAMAQAHSNAPLVVIGDESPKKAAAVAAAPASSFPNFPDAAITRVGENTTGQHVDVPPTPVSPAAPAAGAAAPTASAPVNPAAPAAPASPISKLWPRNTIEIFMPPCTGLRPQFVVPCTCVITKLMVEMPHDEFLAKSEAGTIEQDPRLMRIRQDCATAPQKKD